METTDLRETMTSTTIGTGSRDGLGAADHDVPYRFGSRPSSRWTYPFTARQYCRLLVLRGRIRDGEYADDRDA
ncbi:MAG TPA: hypothetical protein VK066_22400 [Chloroflexota bacterium]|nr:hypothetical protein [Chloroflexota bacterium]